MLILAFWRLEKSTSVLCWTFQSSLSWPVSSWVSLPPSLPILIDERPESPTSWNSTCQIASSGKSRGERGAGCERLRDCGRKTTCTLRAAFDSTTLQSVSASKTLSTSSGLSVNGRTLATFSFSFIFRSAFSILNSSIMHDRISR